MQKGIEGSAWDKENGPDARFWSAWKIWRKLERTWEADRLPEGCEERERRLAEMNSAMNDMLRVPAVTACAVLAKYRATEGECYQLPGAAKDSLTMIGWDLERLAGQELPLHDCALV